MRLHEEQVVAIETITLDPALRDSVRELSQAKLNARSMPSRQLVFPVVEHEGEVVLLGEFETFLACRAAGLRMVQVWVAELEPGGSLLDLAVAFAL